MCGILLRVSKAQYAEVSCIPNLSAVNEKNFPHQKWETNDKSIINHFTNQGSKVKSLSKQQIYKLNNLDNLRLLNSQLSKIKNNVKISANEKTNKITEVQSKINEITKEDQDEIKKNDFDELIYKTSNRGPNYLNYTKFKHDGSYFQLFSAILSLRQPFTKQPIFKDEFVLQFNGELYNSECMDSNDTQFIIECLHSNLKDTSDRKSAILKTLNSLNGEWAIILIDLVNDKIYFARDAIGCRSLCYDITDDGLYISSNSTLGFFECSNSAYEYDLKSGEMNVVQLLNLPEPTFEQVDNEQVIMNELRQRLSHSTKIRYESIHPLTCSENESKLAVLFSGGLDCTIIARLLCESISEGNKDSSIDLLSVGFENPRTKELPTSSPDRKLAIKSWFHLCKLFPHLKINLVEIDVDYSSWLIHKSRVRELMFPCNTEMDLSIAIAFYFASSILPDLTVQKKLNEYNVDWEIFEQNQRKYIDITTKYVSSAKVLFSGLGADELFAGYSRHEGIFNILGDSNYEELAQSLNYDIQIIHVRNLGRDDRVINCWGKELRYPYLDEDFIKWVISAIPPQLKLKYIKVNDKKGIEKLQFTRKYILRELAKDLGMDWISNELKRAIQFGAKSAKLEIGQNKSKGTDSL
ncbi:uncharacterized protein KGF55_001447 [Candida pseudojiufengensis]|uniref:uncharacterized protein n=1 Tax=Candida pseudojiufengensis TaxID=497109 RepID=UPI0022249C70|nr:uncharacterized protein KGF55_001447 [Candida pseudojiufengensis]KAI5965227.1 hypothetical protein KGF55_001447 [Candida pseudojiufengensis]